MNFYVSKLCTFNSNLEEGFALSSYKIIIKKKSGLIIRDKSSIENI